MGDKLLEEGTYFIRHDVVEPVVTVDNNIIQSMFRIMDCFLADYIETEIKKVNEEKIDDLFSMVGQLFIFAFIWSHGCTTNLEGRKKFDSFVRKLLPEMSVTIPTEGLVYDYRFNREKKEWLFWKDSIPDYDVDIKASFEQIVVPTNDSIRMKYLCRLLLSNGKNVMCPGPTGTGKSVNTTQLLTLEMPEEFLPLTMTFSAQTSANQT
jgi:dynein heavy chain